MDVVDSVGAATDDVSSGLDTLEMWHGARTPWWRRAGGVVLPKLVAVAVLLGAWQLAVTLHPSDVLPSPGDVWASFLDQARQGHVTEAVSTSLLHGGEGYAIAIVAGTPLGLLIARVRVVRLAIGSIVAALQSLPSVTWVPVGILWFGLNTSMVLFVVVMGALPSIAGGMVSAVDHIPPLLPRVGAALGARGLRLYRHVILPAALPGYVAGLKQAWAFSWRSLMAAEIIATGPDLGRGLGQLLESGRELTDMSLMFASILVILAVGVLVDALVFAPLDRGVRRRRGLSTA
jgi:NitT/TauT family transport system permease protein